MFPRESYDTLYGVIVVRNFRKSSTLLFTYSPSNRGSSRSLSTVSSNFLHKFLRPGLCLCTDKDKIEPTTITDPMISTIPPHRRVPDLREINDEEFKNNSRRESVRNAINPSSSLSTCYHPEWAENQLVRPYRGRSSEYRAQLKRRFLNFC